MPFPFDFPALRNQRSSLNQAVVNALSNFVPAGKYLREGGQTSLGIEIDAECIMNEKGVPFLLAEYDDGKSLPVDTARFVFNLFFFFPRYLISFFFQDRSNGAKL